MADDKEDKDKKEDLEQSAEQGGMESTDVKPVNIGLLEDIQKDEKSLLKKVKIYSPYRVYYEDAADSVSAVNLTGPFDILPGHKNFMTLLNAGEIIVRHKGNAQKLKIERGVMHVRKNEVTIFLDV